MRNFFNQIKDVVFGIIKSSSNTVKINGNDNEVYQYIGTSGIAPIDNFLKLRRNDFGYISFPKFQEIQNLILAENYKFVRIIGLSGLGKTRMLYEIFKNLTNQNFKNYYCGASSYNEIANDLQNLIYENRRRKGIIILDNCDTLTFRCVKNALEDVDTQFRIVSVYNNPNEQLSAPDVNTIVLHRDDMRDSVNQFIKESLTKMGNEEQLVYEQIRNIADGFPTIAIHAIEAYRKSGHPQMVKEEDLWQNICGDILSDDSQTIGIESLALFDPLGCKNGLAMDFDIIKHNKNITPIFEDERKIDLIFHHLINNIKKRELIDESSDWINIRPLPLAVWLVGQWFEDCSDDRFNGVINDIANLQDKNQAKRLSDGLINRMQNMVDNVRAESMIDKIMGIGGNFRNEKVVCSDLGSRLFLVMSTVNHVAVSNCLYNILKDKDTYWLKENVNNNSRRNIIWTLEHLCFASDTFENSAYILAKLAIAENESWSNNATGIFLQLFHIQLPGTEANLDLRFKVLETLYNEVLDSVPLIIKAISNAFQNSFFHRSGGAEKFGYKSLSDYNPSTSEVFSYWEKCAKLLLIILSSFPIYKEDIKKLVTERVFDLGVRSSRWKLLFDLIDKLIDDSEWPEMRSKLLQVKTKHIDKLNETDQAHLNFILGRLSSQNFNTTLNDAKVEYHAKYHGNFDEWVNGADNYFEKYADEFINEKLYKDFPTIKSLLENKNIDLSFVRLIARKMDKKQSSEINEVIEDVYKEQPDTFLSNFASLFYTFTKHDEEYYKFCDFLVDSKCYYQYVVLLSRRETSNLKGLDKIIKLVSTKETPKYELLSLYLQNTMLSGGDVQMFNTCNKIKSVIPNSTDLLLFYILEYEGNDNIILSKKMSETTTRLILDYVPSKNDLCSPHSVNSFACDILNKYDFPGFAKKYNKKIIKNVNDYDSMQNYDFAYFALLPKYEKVVLDDILNAIADNKSLFYYYAENELGSGTNYGIGRLFQCDNEKIKAKCLEERNGVMPERLARLAPIYDTNEENKQKRRFSKFMYWMFSHLSDFKSPNSILNEFSSNMGTYSWTGSIRPLLIEVRESLELLKKDFAQKNKMIIKWASSYIEYLDGRISSEDRNEAYRKLVSKSK